MGNDEPCLADIAQPTDPAHADGASLLKLNAPFDVGNPRQKINSPPTNSALVTAKELALLAECHAVGDHIRFLILVLASLWFRLEEVQPAALFSEKNVVDRLGT